MLAATSMMASTSSIAGQFAVRVLDEAGSPVSGASVCVGLPGNYKQFGALFTDFEGKATVTVPNVPIVVTVSKTRFSGTRISEPARDFNLVKEITLTEGVPGPRCRAGTTMAANPPVIKIADVNVRESGNAKTLTPIVSGEPSHYRLSNTADFEDNDRWIAYDSTIPLPSALSEEREIFLQMRRFEGTPNAWLEARSEVVTVQLPAVR